jgi:hypothetical protein
MAKFSMKQGGKEVGPASIYAEPHNMAGAKVSVMSVDKASAAVEYATNKSAKTAGVNDPLPNGVGYGRSGEAKTTGIKMRGTGAATKGVMSRGPMA